MKRFRRNSAWQPYYAGLLLSLLFTAALVTAKLASAHCDTIDGPVVKSAKVALSTGKVDPALRWVRKKDEPEIRAAFKMALSIRGKSKESQALADRFFFETLVRVHRAGEGEPFTGLKPAGLLIDSVIREADKSLEKGSVDALADEVSMQVREGIKKRFSEAITRKRSADSSVSAGRRYVEAYVEFMDYVESIESAARGG